MSVAGIVLGLLEQAPGHGYDLKIRHDRPFANRRLALPQVYATLGRLERDGHVEVAGVGRSGGPDRRVYGVTPAGVSHLEGWLAEPESSAAHLKSIGFAKVVLALLSGRDARSVIGSNASTTASRCER